MKLNLTNHFQAYLLPIFIVPKFLKFCNHFIINSKKGTMLLLCYFQLFSIYFILLLSKTRPFLTTLEIIIFSIYFTMLSPLHYLLCILYHAFILCCETFGMCLTIILFFLLFSHGVWMLLALGMECSYISHA